MFHIFVASQEDAWDGNAREFRLERCFRYRDFNAQDLLERFGDLYDRQVEKLKKFPCIFTYEGFRLAPKFGRLLDVRRNNQMVRVVFEIVPLDRFLTQEDLRDIASDLDTNDWQLGSSQWMIKHGNLARLLRRKNVILPDWARTSSGNVDIDTHQFAVALSFPGPHRALVESIYDELEHRLGPDKCFYDRNYEAHLARPRMSTLLLNIYRARSELVVVFIGSEYQNRKWCGLELRAIEEIVLNGGEKRVMYVRLDHGRVDGILDTDGYINAAARSPSEIVDLIQQRLAQLAIVGRSA